jgi:hypothetical protein
MGENMHSISAAMMLNYASYAQSLGSAAAGDPYCLDLENAFL